MKYLFLLMFLVGCTNAEIAKVKAYGTEGKISCYSGGKVIYEGIASGKILTEEGSDGWFFEEKGTGRLVRASGDCIIIN